MPTPTKKTAAPAIPKEDGGGLLDQTMTEIIPPTPSAKVDISDPWYRPAKHFIRREQWNKSILSLLNKLPALPAGENRVLRYVGLPGQHNLDLLGMHGICKAKSMQISYLGFRIGKGAPKQPTPVDQLVTLSNNRFHTPDSIIVPDSVESIGSLNTPARKTFQDRGPFDVINLDVCGGILHGDTTPLLNAIKAILSLQNPRKEPWLLFLTTIAKHECIETELLTRFFQTIKENCEQVANFKEHLAEACSEYGVSLDRFLSDPKSIIAPVFQRLFTLAFGKWLLVNLQGNSPRAVITLQSAYLFRNTGMTTPEMLSLSYLMEPIIAGGSDPTHLTSSTTAKRTEENEYAKYAIGLVKPSLHNMRDLDEVWHADSNLMQTIVTECQILLRMIGVDEAGIGEWRSKYKLD